MKRYHGWLASSILLLMFVPSSLAMAQRDVRDRLRDEPSSDREGHFERHFNEHNGARQAEPRLVPPVADRRARWLLGVLVAYRDTGAECTSVVRRSPARGAGLEAQDVIVAVNGYQVGYINGRLYRLERELEIRADRQGRVRLLVQNHRNGNLANVDIRLDHADRRRDLMGRDLMGRDLMGRDLTGRDLTGRDPLERSDELIGTVTSRRVTQMPENAVLVVSLVDVTDRLSSLNPIAQRTYDGLGPLPIPFELPYDSDRIEPGREYMLRAYVTVNGVTALSTRDIYKVFTAGQQGRIDLELERAR